MENKDKDKIRRITSSAQGYVTSYTVGNNKECLQIIRDWLDEGSARPTKDIQNAMLYIAIHHDEPKLSYAKYSSYLELLKRQRRIREEFTKRAMGEDPDYNGYSEEFL